MKASQNYLLDNRLGFLDNGAISIQQNDSFFHDKFFNARINCSFSDAVPTVIRRHPSHLTTFDRFRIIILRSISDFHRFHLHYLLLPGENWHHWG